MALPHRCRDREGVEQIGSLVALLVLRCDGYERTPDVPHLERIVRFVPRHAVGAAIETCTVCQPWPTGSQRTVPYPGKHPDQRRSQSSRVGRTRYAPRQGSGGRSSAAVSPRRGNDSGTRARLVQADELRDGG